MNQLQPVSYTISYGFRPKSLQKYIHQLDTSIIKWRLGYLIHINAIFFRLSSINLLPLIIIGDKIWFEEETQAKNQNLDPATDTRIQIIHDTAAVHVPF